MQTTSFRASASCLLNPGSVCFPQYSICQGFCLLTSPSSEAPRNSMRWDTVQCRTEAVKRVLPLAIDTYLDHLLVNLLSNLAINIIPVFHWPLRLVRHSFSLTFFNLYLSISQLCDCNVPLVLTFSDVCLPTLQLTKPEMSSSILNYWHQCML